MASNYGRNFGFRISDETRRSSVGRWRTPKTGPVLLIGTAVEQDPTNPEYLRQCAAGATLRTGISGLLVQELQQFSSIYAPEVQDSFSLGFAKKNALSVVTSGPGTKVWFKNTPAQDRIDGRHIDPVTLVAVTGLAVGDFLGWNGTQFAEVAAGATAWGQVTDVRPNYCELSLLA